MTTRLKKKRKPTQDPSDRTGYSVWYMKEE